MISPTDTSGAFNEVTRQSQVFLTLFVVEGQEEESHEGSEISVSEFEMGQVEGGVVEHETENRKGNHVDGESCKLVEDPG